MGGTARVFGTTQLLGLYILSKNYKVTTLDSPPAPRLFIRGGYVFTVYIYITIFID